MGAADPLRRFPAWLQRSLAVIAAFITIPSALVALVGQSESLWWPGALCCHWTLHAALGLVVGAVFWHRHRHTSRLCILLMFFALWPWLRSAFATRAPVAQKSQLSVVWNNLYRFNNHRAEALDLMRDSDADLIGLTEVLPSDRAIVAQDPRWPHQVWTPRDGILACALLSRKPIVTQAVYDLDGTEVIAVVLDMGEQPLRVLVAHLTAPLNPAWSAIHDRQFAKLAELANRQDLPTLVLGDFNTTPAARLWQPFLRLSGLQRPSGLTPATWPAWSSPWPRCPGISIDHILVRDGALAPLETFWVPGSDHLGLKTIWAPVSRP